MILVTLGTQDKSFERLLNEIDKLIDKKVIKDKVIVQAGYTKYHSENMEIFDLIDKDQFDILINQCDLLITHGGAGSILTGLKKNKKVIAIPRLKKYKEHTNDHQLEIINEFTDNGYILSCIELEDLKSTFQLVEKFIPKKYKSNNDEIINNLKNYIKKDKNGFWFMNVVNLFNKYKEVIMYLIFGVLSTIISLVTYYVLVLTILNPNNVFELQLANFISWIFAVTFAYITNRTLVFESKNENKLKEATSFISSRILTLILDMGIMFLGVTVLLYNDKFMKLLSQVIVIVANYALSKLFVFKKES